MPKPILVIGDACTDTFVYCHCKRLCPEAPVPVLDIVNQESNLGMAGNVYSNVLALDYPAILRCNPNYEQITKTRYVDIKTNHMFLRIDGKGDYPTIEHLNRIRWDDYEAVVISDYNKGFLSFNDIEYITQNHCLTFLDTKKVLGAWARCVTFIKINRNEYDLSRAFIESELGDQTIETLGCDGCRFKGKIYPVNNVEIKNLSGAGDSFLAGLVVKYIQSRDMEQALPYANDIATIVVQKKGVSTIKN